jgi:hypothetical protein
VKNEGVTPKVIKLPSTFNQKRKSMLVKKWKISYTKGFEFC